MSNLSNNRAMDASLFSEMKRQASFFFKEKLRSARLAFTDVTPAQLMTEEVTNGSPWAPDVQAMGFISKAAFEIGDYWKIVEVLHKRITNFDKKNWRQSYQALVLLEYLLTHGPESVAREFESDIEVIEECGRLQYIDERGFNWGLAVRNKCERILMLLDDRQLLKEERQRSRKISLGRIRGFGSFSGRSLNSTTQSCRESGDRSFERCNSEFGGHVVDSVSTDGSFTASSKSRSSSEFSADSESTASSARSWGVSSFHVKKQIDEPNSMEETKGSLINSNKNEELISCKYLTQDEHDGDWESQPLLGVQKEETITPVNHSMLAGNSHPFDHLEAQSRESLLSGRVE